jgi:CHAD domain-containing protein/CYTH domain-containing protein
MARLPPDLLDLPAERGARLVARELLRRARALSKRLGPGDAPDALHDFRVALRRVRSWMRAYRPYLGKSIPKRGRKALRALAEATNAGRDAEVHLAWVQQASEGLGPEHLGGAAWLTGRLEERRDQAYRGAVRRTGTLFDRVEPALRSRLRRPTGPEGDRFGPVTATLLQAHAVAVRQRLDQTRGPADDPAIHAARIRAKRLRYLLEPLEPYREEVPALIRRLRGLQDLLGELHDLHVLMGELPNPRAPAAARPGLAALAERAAAREADLFATLRQEWLAADAGELFTGIQSLAHGLLAAGPAREIEHKYLLTAVPLEVLGAPGDDIHQGWIPGEVLQERLRVVGGPGGERYYRCVKAGRGLERLELEEETSKELFETLWPLTEGKRVAKRRYYRPEGDLTWEVDQFRDRDLVLAEVEVPTARRRVPIPAWLKPVVVREVTGEAEYVNVNLAR